jgi:hypothetical protein
MAVCAICNRETQEADGCLESWVDIFAAGKPPKRLPPIRFGDELQFGPHSLRVMATVERCPYCKALRDDYHHPGCYGEECPNCHRRMLICGGECA